MTVSGPKGPLFPPPLNYLLQALNCQQPTFPTLIYGDQRGSEARANPTPNTILKSFNILGRTFLLKGKHKPI